MNEVHTIVLEFEALSQITLDELAVVGRIRKCNG